MKLANWKFSVFSFSMMLDIAGRKGNSPKFTDKADAGTISENADLRE